MITCTALILVLVVCQVVDDWSGRSFRLLALAAGTIQNFKRLDAQTLTLQQSEAAVSHMSLVGLLVITNTLRADSKDTIAELQNEYASCADCLPASCVSTGQKLMPIFLPLETPIHKFCWHDDRPNNTKSMHLTMAGALLILLGAGVATWSCAEFHPPHMCTRHLTTTVYSACWHPSSGTI